MISIEEMDEILNEISFEFPDEFYKMLNGGIVLQPEAKLHSEDRGKDLYILGEYTRGGLMGRYISIYYGSFSQAYGNLTKDELKEKLRGVVKHEFLHHLESMAGENGLEIKDMLEIEKYLKRNEHNKIQP